MRNPDGTWPEQPACTPESYEVLATLHALAPATCAEVAQTLGLRHSLVDQRLRKLYIGEHVRAVRPKPGAAVLWELTAAGKALRLREYRRRWKLTRRQAKRAEQATAAPDSPVLRLWNWAGLPQPIPHEVAGRVHRLAMDEAQG
jgi:hypothetical protein